MLDYILCEQLISIKKISPATTPNEFMKIAEHNCNRDLDSIKTQTQYTIDELHTITQLKFNISEEPVWTDFFAQFPVWAIPALALPDICDACPE